MQIKRKIFKAVFPQFYSVFYTLWVDQVDEKNIRCAIKNRRGGVERMFIISHDELLQQVEA